MCDVQLSTYRACPLPGIKAARFRQAATRTSNTMENDENRDQSEIERLRRIHREKQEELRRKEREAERLRVRILLH